MAVFLIFTLPNGRETKVHLESRLLIGRGDDCDVVIGEAGVSSNHAMISLDSLGKVFIKDLKSSNGSFKNGEQISETHLQVNDVLNINKVKVRIEGCKLTEKERDIIGSSKPSYVESELSLPGLSIVSKKSS